VPEFEAVFTAASGSLPSLAATPVEAKTSGMAIASLVLGILGLCGITALVGLILGIISLGKINRSGGRLSGQGLAIAGICVSGFMFLFSIPFMAGLTLPAFAKASQRAQTINCVNNLKQLGLAVRIYASDHNDLLPPAATWCDAIQSQVGSPKVFQCPAEPGRRCAYAFNAKLDGKKEAEINPQTVLLFESDAGWNGTGGAGNLNPHKHSRRSVNVAFADGSVQQLPRSQLGTLRWEP
jgi:prepilin-type processing-associated H-X9-DG protein